MPSFGNLEKTPVKLVWPERCIYGEWGKPGILESESISGVGWLGVFPQLRHSPPTEETKCREFLLRGHFSLFVWTGLYTLLHRFLIQNH